MRENSATLLLTRMTFKLAACDGMTFQQLAAKQTGVTEQDYVEMMLAGGRPIEGNRSRREQSGEPGNGEEGESHG